MLIVDDDPSWLKLYTERFIQEGFNVVTAQNGQEGVRKTFEEHPGIILLDIKMPVMDGKEMLRLIRVSPQFNKTPVIILTNRGQLDNIQETKVYFHANEFLVKSAVTIEDVVAKVRELSLLIK